MRQVYDRLRRRTVEVPDWFAKPELIPPLELAEAQRRFTEAATHDGVLDEDTFAYQMRNYRLWRAGRIGSGNAARFDPSSCRSHDDTVALTLDKCACAHEFARVRRFEDVNPVLGTGERGHILECRKCGAQDREVTWVNRWSGD